VAAVFVEDERPPAGDGDLVVVIVVLIHGDERRTGWCASGGGRAQSHGVLRRCRGGDPLREGLSAAAAVGEEADDVQHGGRGHRAGHQQQARPSCLAHR